MEHALHATLLGLALCSSSGVALVAQETDQVVDLGVPPGGEGRGAEDVNEQGDAVGSSFVGGTFRPVLYRNGSAIDLGVPPGGVGYASATGINERGEVCGVRATGGSTHITLPGGLSFRLDVDPLTAPLLARTQVLLDALGHAVTPALAVPNDPTLVGRPFWSVSLIQDVATGRILAASTTVYDTLE